MLLNKLLKFDVGNFYKEMFTQLYKAFDFTLIIFGVHIRFYYIIFFCIIVYIVLKLIYTLIDLYS